MTIKGNKKSHNISGYKSEDELTDKHPNMPDITHFNKELIVCTQEAAKSGDKLFIAKPATSAESILEGSFGCYVPEGRPGILEQIYSRMDRMELEFRSELNSTSSELHSTRSELHSTRSELHSTRSELNSTRSELSSTRSELEMIKRVSQQQLAQSFEIDMVHLVRRLYHAKVFKMVPETVKKNFPKGRTLFFDNVLPSLDKDTRDLIEADPSFKILNEISSFSEDFKSVVANRNAATHPASINLRTIRDKANLIGDGDQLSPKEKAAFGQTKAIFEKIETLYDLNDLIESFINKDDEDNEILKDLINHCKL